MGLEDLLKKKAAQKKVRKTVLTSIDISKAVSETEKNRNEEIISRPNASEKISWFSKKDDAEWISGPSDDDDENQIIIEPIKKEEQVVENQSKPPSTPTETTHVWGAVKSRLLSLSWQ
ncbi:hypothetical protein Ciccas_008617 [Cichlidogyrus casuarinus]|uniref:Uncharacterized protein n=1 Tax=Cichlidogyrus casuarinus TaxID=1844966 RepID=A0ABD2Q3P9_9PLAT